MEQNPDTCLLFNSPEVYYTKEQCWQNVEVALNSEVIQAQMIALEMEVVNLECYDVRRKGIEA